MLLSGHRVLDSVAVSFLFAYLSLWLVLLHDALALLYNKLYEYITKASGSPQDAAPDSYDAPAPNEDEVPEV